MKWIKLLVVCCIVCVIKCSAMSLDEIEEFTDFLEKTSHLDEPLKKGSSPDDDFYDDDPVSDHAWEESGKFEGDLILNERQRRLIVEDVTEGLSRNGLTDSTKRWPNNEVIYYIQKDHFSDDQVSAIKNGIDDIAQASCITFRPYKKGDRDAVVIQGSRRGCFSQVGYQSGYQVLNLSGRHPVGRGCFRHGTVVHELLHTLGFYHMQSSPDRDDHVDVIWENIIKPARHNFRKYNTFAVSDFGVGYDYDSVLHYSRRAFSSNGGDTLVPKESGASIGQRVGLSDKDTQKLNKMYCDADSDNREEEKEEEETTQKPIAKKKKPKNKPFQGHGIGYHQGKTVVIKLPAAETSVLNDFPTFHMFDSFSKTPQTVPPTLVEGFRIGKEIENSHGLPVDKNNKDLTEYTGSQHNNEHFNDDNKNNYNNYENINDENENNDKNEGYPNEKNKNHNKLNEKSNDDSKNNYNKVEDISKPTDTSNEENNQTSDNSSENEDDSEDYLDDDFDRLGKIIKTHVYPSQIPDFSIYKHSDYDKFDKTDIPKVDEALELSSLREESEDNQHDKPVFNEKLPEGFIESLFSQDNSVPERDHDSETYEENNLQKPDTYTKDYPLSESYVIKDDEIKSSDDSGLEKTKNDNDNIIQYNSAKKEDTESSKKPHTDSYITGYPLIKIHATKDDEIETSDYSKLENLQNEHNSTDSPATKENIESVKGQQTLFGYIVPLNDIWYKNAELKQFPVSHQDDHTNQSNNKNSNSNAQGLQFSSEARNDSSSPNKQAYSLFGILVPLANKWYKVDSDIHVDSYSIQNPKSYEDNR